jgi:hypothetical protein
MDTIYHSRRNVPIMQLIIKSTLGPRVPCTTNKQYSAKSGSWSPGWTSPPHPEMFKIFTSKNETQNNNSIALLTNLKQVR